MTHDQPLRRIRGQDSSGGPGGIMAVPFLLVANTRARRILSH